MVRTQLDVQATINNADRQINAAISSDSPMQLQHILNVTNLALVADIAKSLQRIAEALEKSNSRLPDGTY